MKKISSTVLFFGTEDFSCVTLKALVEAGYHVGAVITKPDARRGRGKGVTEPAVKTYATQHNIPVWQPGHILDITEAIAAFEKPVGVLVSYGKILPQQIIDLFSPGIINVHPSLLPSYRGPTPIESAIINGDTTTGISIIQLSAAMDAGPIYHQTAHPLTGHETKPELYGTLAKKGAEALLEVLPDIIEGNLSPQPQNDSHASYCTLLSKQDTVVDPATLSAAQLERRIRAHIGFPKTRLPFYGNEVIITKAHTTSTPSATTIACKDTTLLAIDQLVAPSGKTMSAEAYLRGKRL